MCNLVVYNLDQIEHLTSSARNGILNYILGEQRARAGQSNGYDIAGNKQSKVLMRQRDESYAKLLDNHGIVPSLNEADPLIEGNSGTAAGPPESTYDENEVTITRRQRRRYPSRKEWLKISNDSSVTTLSAARSHIIKDLAIPPRDLRYKFPNHIKMIAKTKTFINLFEGV